MHLRPASMHRATPERSLTRRMPLIPRIMYAKPRLHGAPPAVFPIPLFCAPPPGSPARPGGAESETTADCPVEFCQNRQAENQRFELCGLQEAANLEVRKLVLLEIRQATYEFHIRRHPPARQDAHPPNADMRFGGQRKAVACVNEQIAAPPRDASQFAGDCPGIVH